MMKKNPLLELESLGQSIWMDFIRRNVIVSGELQTWIDEDGVSGITSNPAIFEKAIGGSNDYDDSIRALALSGKNVSEIYRDLTVDDIQRAADHLLPVYQRTQGQDGFVSLEVSPRAANDTTASIEEGRELWQAVNRPNLMIKIPATLEGLPAIRQLLSEGVNVNITLLFGLPRYREVAEAYVAGLEDRVSQGLPLDRIASVASFFLSRIDTLVDPVLEKKALAGGHRGTMAGKLRGETAIASARVAYQIYKELFGSERFRRLEAQGARPQRLLWASTSTKNPTYSDVKYVDALIGPNTIDTLPVETLEAYRDHGSPAPRLEEGTEDAQRVLQQLAQVGIDIDDVTRQLEIEGIQKFVEPFDKLAKTLEKKSAAALAKPVDRQKLDLKGYQQLLNARLSTMEATNFVPRMWKKDPTLWKGEQQQQAGIRGGLGWLHMAEKMEENLSDLYAFLEEVKADGFRRVVHMGMGGSSLAPMVFERTFTPSKGGLTLTVLDTTDPEAILRIRREEPLADTLFIVASKSGTTAEPLAFGEYFYSLLKEIKGNEAGRSFVAITDPATPLVKIARERGYRHTFLNYADIGGRYSALSYFGLLPAALMGLDVSELLERALRMSHACDPCVAAHDSPGIRLGAALGELALRGRNKVTFVAPEAISSLGMWLEQLLAESTGKEGTGLLPVSGEAVGDPSVYENDRVFVHFQIGGRSNGGLDQKVAALLAAGHPVITIQMDDLLDVGQEFFRWEIATATAGAVLGINPFDQPNVQESKDNTDRLLEAARGGRTLPEEFPGVTTLDLRSEGAGDTAARQLGEFAAQVPEGGYIAIQAFVTESPETEQALQSLRTSLRDSLHVATTVGFGPRFLHSTGQFHKGGPNTGLFIQMVSEDSEDTPIPGHPYSFESFKRAQAQGDLEALQKHGRKVIRVFLSSDTAGQLTELAGKLHIPERRKQQQKRAA